MTILATIHLVISDRKNAGWRSGRPPFPGLMQHSRRRLHAPTHDLATFNTLAKAAGGRTALPPSPHSRWQPSSSHSRPSQPGPGGGPPANECNGFGTISISRTQAMRSHGLARIAVGCGTSVLYARPDGPLPVPRARAERAAASGGRSRRKTLVAGDPGSPVTAAPAGWRHPAARALQSAVVSTTVCRRNVPDIRSTRTVPRRESACYYLSRVCRVSACAPSLRPADN